MKGTERYAAKLLFQFRIVLEGKSNKRRMCESRIIIIQAKSAREALRKARERGKKAKRNFRDDDGNMVHFEFVGVQDLMHLGIECAEDEVWYDIKEYLRPMERKADLIPGEDELSAIKFEKKWGTV